ncbi:MAG: hypothetical protein U0Q16_22490 [Bryobacteraceae bacterium]
MTRFILVVVSAAMMIGCGGTQEPAAAPAAASGPPTISKLVPPGTVEKTPFQMQAGGKSAISVEGSGFAPGSAVYANGQKLTTAFGNAGWVTAELPPELFAKAGGVAIKVMNSDGKESNAVEFRVSPPQ